MPRAPGELTAELEATEFCPLTGDLTGAKRPVERALLLWRGLDPLAQPKPQLEHSNEVLRWLGRDRRVSGATLARHFGPYAERFGYRGETGESIAGAKELVLLNSPAGEPRDQCEVNAEAARPLLREEFTRGGVMVAVGADSKLQPLVAGLIADRLTRHVVFGRYAEDAKAGWKLQKTEPPAHVCAYLGSERLAGARPLEALLSIPTLNERGELLCAAGYYPDSGFLMLQDFPFTALPPEAALAALRDPFRDFVFEAPEGLSVALAAVLTVVARPLLWRWAAPCPGFAIDAADGGTGKSLLTDCILGCAGYGPGECSSLNSTNPDEMQKRIDAALFAGERILLFNNVRTGSEFGSATIDDWLTQGKTVKARVLGASENREVAALFTVLINGNQISFAGETARRFMRARIHRPRTLTRSEAQLRALVQANRPLLLSAALCLLQARLASPAPAAGLECLSSFDAWSWLVAGALEQAGLPNPIGCQVGLAELDAGRDDLAAALSALFELVGDGEFSVGQLKHRAGSQLYALYQLVRPWAKDRPEQVSESAYGRALAAIRQRDLGGLMLIARKTTVARTWRIARTR